MSTRYIGHEGAFTVSLLRYNVEYLPMSSLEHELTKLDDGLVGLDGGGEGDDDEEAPFKLTGNHSHPLRTEQNATARENANRPVR